MNHEREIAEHIRKRAPHIGVAYWMGAACGVAAVLAAGALLLTPSQGVDAMDLFLVLLLAFASGAFLGLAAGERR